VYANTIDLVALVLKDTVEQQEDDGDTRDDKMAQKIQLRWIDFLQNCTGYLVRVVFSGGSQVLRHLASLPEHLLPQQRAYLALKFLYDISDMVNTLAFLYGCHRLEYNYRGYQQP
jgi:hypothetical protein